MQPEQYWDAAEYRFQKEAYLETVLQHDREFYEAFVENDAFTQYASNPALACKDDNHEGKHRPTVLDLGEISTQVIDHKTTLKYLESMLKQCVTCTLCQISVGVCRGDDARIVCHITMRHDAMRLSLELIVAA